ncbi:hypothetical protein B5807_01943 [Epicoccum nigrum]|uniref:Uncharacterized protein n=1 Tax=Epicoccum nigrum TaxID=105696 RepID=A0A1Y2M9Q3_EPING|nr:hypothetical protein B5807_01943 [Epicoccum nigrum]
MLQAQNCRISFIRQDDCSSRGRSIPDPTSQHQNSSESDFMTLPKFYDLSVVLLDRALQEHRSSALGIHLTTDVSSMRLLAYLAHLLAPRLRRFQLMQGYGVDQAKAECQASVHGDLWIKNTWGSSLSSTCRCLVSSKDAQRVLLRQRVLWTLRVFKQQSWMTGLSVKPQTVNLGCALSVAFRAGLTVRPEI